MIDKGDPYTPEIDINGQSYFPAPYSIHPLPPRLSAGLIPVGIFALLSVASTITLICFISWRFATWKLHYRTFIGYNQYVVLVLNLLLADLQQSSGFLISFHWIYRQEIVAPSSACFAQGWLIHSGDVGSGLFVLAIAVHTFYTAVYGRRISNKVFACGIVGLWLFAYLLTAVGVGMHGNRYFVRAGAWCWVSESYEADRLAFHYIWIFVIEFGTVLIYLVTFYQLRRKTSRLFTGGLGGHNAGNRSTIEAVNRITKLMTLYPCVYVMLTLPLSAGRMWSMAHGGQGYSTVFACLAGSMITSCGWVDSLLYTLTRKRLLQDTMPGHASSGRRTGELSDNWEATELGDKGITHTRTVTVEGGQMMDTYHHHIANQNSMSGTAPRSRTWEARPPSPNGSIDPILSGIGSVGGRNNKTEVSVGLEQIMAEESEEDDIAALPRYIARGPVGQGYEVKS
ncbi:hypothetical protein LTR62_004624 [Meristemomyces frigidus]|uniref:G protein-coupled receptor GPR1/2/3 C-terminal domain-containing protein n=1 Tax=Meristemomyces frigidus TaxID=1508187 RepID=A0AAN7YFY2_9PEZI|nr:hypothetical protein LTR62_004624 [Meristemomyces frigidus]